ncbi:MAG: hypothetical protein ABW007_19440 [Chitinophagaceae bacterium]
MSHTSEITDSAFTDEKMLEAAVSSLKAQGVAISFQKGGMPRMFYADQFQKYNNGKDADFVVKLENCPYDIGFVRKEGKLNPIFDEWNSHIANQLGMKEVTGYNAKDKTHHIRRLNMEYQLAALKATARKKNMRVGDVKRSADGQIRLTVHKN